MINNFIYHLKENICSKEEKKIIQVWSLKFVFFFFFMTNKNLGVLKKLYRKLKIKIKKLKLKLK
jgi:hypothetical protein